MLMYSAVDIVTYSVVTTIKHHVVAMLTYGAVSLDGGVSLQPEPLHLHLHSQHGLLLLARDRPQAIL